MQGNIAPGYASFDGCPINADTTVFNATRGTRVLDTTTGALYIKISPLGDNSCFRTTGVNMAWTEDFNAYDTNDQVVLSTTAGAAFSGTGQVVNHMYSPQGIVYGINPIGTQTLTPTIVATGLDIGADQTNNDGIEIYTHWNGTTGRPFVVGLDPAFFFEVKMAVGDADGLDTLLVGFRKAQAPAAAYTTYTDFAGLGVNTAADPMLIKVITDINASGSATVTSTTQTVTASGAGTVPFTLGVYVSAAGVVTYKVDLANSGTLAAPTVTAAFTFDNGDPIIPLLYYIQDTNVADSVVIYSYRCGYQA